MKVPVPDTIGIDMYLIWRGCTTQDLFAGLCTSERSYKDSIRKYKDSISYIKIVSGI